MPQDDPKVVTPRLNTMLSQEEIEMVSIKSRIPLFWCDKPRLWFAQFETMIANQKLGDEGKFGLVVAQLTKADVEQIGDIIMAAPNTGRYEQVKKRLISVYEESEGKQLRKLLTEMDLGDQRPSHLLRRMKDLARGKMTDPTLRLLWMEHLPASSRAVLAVSNEENLDTLAAMADKMHEYQKEVSTVCSCQNPPSTSQAPAAEEGRIMKMIEALTKEVASIKMNHASYHPRRQRYYRDRSRSRSRSRSQGRHSKMCYFHRKFGKEAYRCRSPCNFQKQQLSQPEN